MDEPRPDGAVDIAAVPSQPNGSWTPPADRQPGRRVGGERSPSPDWPPWAAPLALVAGLALALIGGLLVELPALALGASITSTHTPTAVADADTFVQDLGFVGAAVWCARLGGRTISAWQFGLRPPGGGWRSALKGLAVLLIAYAALSVAWAEAFNPSREKVLEQIGADVLSAALVCVVAPFCEEFLFRGFIFTALRNWRGTLPAAVISGLLFGAVHAGSAPALDLVPLAALGFGLCMLYRYTGSLYPGMAAHSLNNSLAFASLASLTFGEGVLLAAGALAGLWLIVAVGKRVRLIAPEPRVGLEVARPGA